MFYLTTHSTDFILWLYGIGHMVKDHSDSERGNLLPPHGLLFLNKQVRKEMFYLTTHSTDFILWLYGIGHMVNDQSDSERGNLLPPHGLLFLNKQVRKEMFYLTTHSTYFILWLYGVGHMVNDHSDSERGNLMPRKSSIIRSTCREERPPNDGTITNYIFKRHAQYMFFYSYMALDIW